MPIDSVCSGCGKTLRVNDEFAGRKARCPVCGTVYIAGEIVGEQPHLPSTTSDAASLETVYSQKIESNPVANPLQDSWASLPTAKPIDSRSGIPEGTSEPIAFGKPETTKPSTTSSPSVASSISPATIAPELKYLVRTPNSMIYGPATVETVHDWITEGRLDDSCHIREETSEQWLGIPAWKFQSRQQQNPMSHIGYASPNHFGQIPVPSIQSVGHPKAGNGGLVLILGLISWVLCPTFIGSIVCGILAIIFAMTELKKIKNGQSPEKEKSLVLIGLFLAVANLAAWCFGIVGLIVIAIINP